MAEEKIHIDVLTLDSVQCAACGYMMESIAALPGDVQEMIEYKEWSIKNLSLIHISEPTRPTRASRMPSYA